MGGLRPVQTLALETMRTWACDICPLILAGRRVDVDTLAGRHLHDAHGALTPDENAERFGARVWVWSSPLDADARDGLIEDLCGAFGRHTNSRRGCDVWAWHHQAILGSDDPDDPTDREVAEVLARHLNDRPFVLAASWWGLPPVTSVGLALAGEAS